MHHLRIAYLGAAVAALTACGTARDVDTSSSGIHVSGYADPAAGAFHGADALKFLTHQPGANDCTLCHGRDLNGAFGPSCNQCHAAAGWGADWTTNCTFCHGAQDRSFAYPRDLAQAAPVAPLPGDPEPDRVGAHRKHVAAGSRTNGFACATCHAVPTPAEPLAHLDGKAPVSLGGAGQASLPADVGTYDASTKTCAGYCHGSTLQGGSLQAPAWTTTNLACNTCHGLSPSTGKHPGPGGSNFAPHAFMATACNFCHQGVVDAGMNIVDGSKHVNGVKDVSLITGTFAAGTCSNVACHGSNTSQPW